MRGELALEFSTYTKADGSSPHAWGTLDLLFIELFLGRFIPTCVGNSLSSSRSDREPTVHPHMRGELQSQSRVIYTVRGSSPHAWGTQHANDSVGVCVRFIPTCVGNSCHAFCFHRGSSVHPHMRGELFLEGVPTRRPFGSSPHAWGTPVSAVLRIDVMRFIPICVGNSHRSPGRPARWLVHPHMRGELSRIA